MSNERIKLSYYWFNRHEILQKVKEKATEYYAQNREAIKEKSRDCYKNLSQEKTGKMQDYQRKKYQEFVQFKKEALKNK